MSTHRRFWLQAEDRVVTLAVDPRLVQVIAEGRAVVLPVDLRSVQVEADRRTMYIPEGAT